MSSKTIISIIFLIVLAIAGVVYDKDFRNKVNTLTPAATVEAIKVGAPVVSSGAMQSIIDKGLIRVSVQDPSKPFYFSESGRAKGFNVDFLNAVLAQSEFGGKVKLDTNHAIDTYAGVPKQLLERNKVDIAIDGLTFDDFDLPGVVYTTPYVKDFGYSLIVTKGTAIASAADVTKLGVLQGDPDARAFAESTFPGATIVELSDKADADGKWIVGHLKSKKVDAVMYDYPFAVAEVNGTDLQFAMTKIKGSDIQYRIGVRKEDKDLLAALNSAIRKVTDTPEYTEMLKKYFMSDKTAAVRRASSGEASYVVAKGDTLSTVAQTQLGDKMKYGDIQTRNNLANPNFIAVGQKLIIPTKG